MKPTVKQMIDVHRKRKKLGESIRKEIARHTRMSRHHYGLHGNYKYGKRR